MNFSRLRAFDAAMRSGGFTAAAERLAISQPAVTSHVRSLEDFYQVTLFRRRGRRVEPTPMGRRLGEITHRLFALAEEAEDLLRAAKELREGELVVAAGSPHVAVPLLAAFRRRHPGIRLTLTIGNSEEVLAALLAERCDVTVQAELAGHPGVQALACREQPILAFVDQAHPWARSGRTAIPLRDLDGQAIVAREPDSITRRTFEAACREAAVVPAIALEIADREAVKEAVAAGLGIGIVAAAELGRDDRIHPLSIEHPGLTTRDYVLCLERRARLSLIRAFFAIARDVAPTLGRA